MDMILINYMIVVTFAIISWAMTFYVIKTILRDYRPAHNRIDEIYNELLNEFNELHERFKEINSKLEKIESLTMTAERVKNKIDELRIESSCSFCRR